MKVSDRSTTSRTLIKASLMFALSYSNGCNSLGGHAITSTARLSETDPEVLPRMKACRLRLEKKLPAFLAFSLLPAAFCSFNGHH